MSSRAPASPAILPFPSPESGAASDIAIQPEHMRDRRSARGLLIVVAVGAVLPAWFMNAVDAQTSSPYGGSPVSLPGTVQAENFDNGGINVAYWDKDSTNKGGKYRSTAVDIESTADSGGGHNVGWIAPGEWLAFTVNVAAAGTYTLQARVAAPSAGGTFHVEFGGVNKTGPMTMPGTGSYQAWTTISKTVTLSAGTQIMKVVFDAAGPSGSIGNLNWVRLVSSTMSTPFQGSPAALPGTVQAENFDNGGQNVAYWDKDSTNKGGQYRSTAVDIEATADSGGGYNVGWIAPGEWLAFTVNVAAAGTYTLQARVAAPSAGGTFHVEFGGVNKTGTMTIPATGSYQTWTTVSESVSLAAGTQGMRVVFDAAGPSGGVGNLNWIRLTSSGGGSTSLFRDPYLQQVTSTSAIVVWATPTAGQASVRYQASGQSARTASAASTFYAATQTGLSTDFYQHAATLTQLAPSTEYAYDVLLDGTDLTTGTDRFRTAPLEGSSTVRFIAYGDSGVGSTEQRQLAARMAADNFDLAIHTGDVAYGAANTSGGGSHSTLRAWFFDIYEDWLRRKPFFPSIGNHDDEVAFARPYRDVFVLPPDGASSGYADHAERFYSFDYGPAHFVALDTERAFQDSARRAAQVAWLETDLANTAQPWKIVYFHRPPYSSSAGHGSDLAVRQAFVPIFERHGVQLVIAGHDHAYERSTPWRSGSASTRPVTYIVTGGGGARLYSAGQAAWTVKSASVHHYVRANVTDCQLYLVGVGLDGRSFDGMTLDRCAQEQDARAPTVSIASPASGASVQGIVAVTVSAADDRKVEKVDLWVDGQLIAIDATSPYSFSWDSRAVANGSRQIQARAYDIAGRISTTSRTVTVAN